MLPLAIGVLLLILLTATAARYATFRSTVDHYDGIGATVFFIAVGLPAVIVGLVLIARYVVSGT
jgi:hypothetical protein